jgi:hypothetical protein
MNEKQVNQTPPSAENDPAKHELAEAGKRAGLHLAAIVGGLIMMIVGLGMGVTMVLLPIAIPLGLIGVVLAIWGFFGWSAT